MWFFIVFTQLLAVITSTILWWLILPKKRRSQLILVASVFSINNIVLAYGLSEFWGERFHVYLVVGILQGFMGYALLITAVIALFYNKGLKKRASPLALRGTAVGMYIGIVSLALFNAYSPVVHHVTVSIDKPLAKPLSIALLSDTHLGRWFGNRQIDKMVSLVDAHNPDVVLIAGDIMNDTTIAYDSTNMHQRLSRLTAPLGVYATLGNHDYLGYEAQIAAAVERAGIKVLDNKSVRLDESVWLIGRSDDTDLTRLSTAELLTQVDTDQPVIFLEHQPSTIDEVSGFPIDLHLSGHTHGGQIFPLTTLMRWFTPLAYGSKQLNDTHFLVTSGYGIGAVPFRLGTRSEIWMIKLQGKS